MLIAFLSQAKRRSFAGNVALIFFAIAFVLVVVAFSTPSWIVSDYRITGARLNRFGLWVQCFRSLPDPMESEQRMFFVGCRWVYDPFTYGYDKIRGFLMPWFIITTQFFFTLCFISVLLGAVLSLVYFLCGGPDQKHFIRAIKVNAILLMAGGICGVIEVIVFASTANRKGWLPGHDNNFFGWSFALAVIGSAFLIIASGLLFVDANIHERKQEYLTDSQVRFELEHESKA